MNDLAPGIHSVGCRSALLVPIGRQGELQYILGSEDE
jgi:hypothetical protein